MYTNNFERVIIFYCFLDSRVTPVVPERIRIRSRTDPEKQDNRLSDSAKYEPILMSITEIRKHRRLDPEYVMPISFCSSNVKLSSTASLAPTKEVDGKLYAIANPEMRDESKHYQQPTTQYSSNTTSREC